MRQRRRRWSPTGSGCCWGSALAHDSQKNLVQWLMRGQMGLDTLRAGSPKTWTVGDKTGLGGPQNAHGDSSTRNDVAIAWPPGGQPVLIAAYLTGSTLEANQRDAIFAEIGRIFANMRT
jgi:beta-lactamase class A